MKRYFLLFASFCVVFKMCLIAIASPSLNAASSLNFQNKKMSFWESQKKGANIFNKNIPLETIKAAKNYGIQFIRLAPDKFPSKKRDFLIGDADNYQGLVPQDLKMLKNTLDLFHKEGIPVVLTMLSLPGSRWIQHNNNVHDLRLWTA